MDRGLWQAVQQAIRQRPPAAPISGKRPKRNGDERHTDGNPENLRRRVRHLAIKWPDIARVVDAAVTDYGRGQGGRGRTGGDKRDRRDIYPRQWVHLHPRLGVTHQSGLVRDQRGRLNDQRGRQVEYFSNDCTHCSRKGNLNRQCWRKYPHLHSIQSPARSNGVSLEVFPPAVVYGQRNVTTKECFDRRQQPRFRSRGSNGFSRLLQQADPRPPEMKEFVGRKAEHRSETKPTDVMAGTSRRVYGPEKRTGSNPSEYHSECVRYPAEVQCLLWCGFEPGPGIPLPH